MFRDDAAVAMLASQIELELPAIPESFGTTTGRPWRVELGMLPTWAIFASAAPALMATFLLFLDQNILVQDYNPKRV